VSLKWLLSKEEDQQQQQQQQDAENLFLDPPFSRIKTFQNV
jgi:16S rRNA G966 N2-methylase RsmD